MDGTEHHEVIVVGGGNAGISVAARLRRYGFDDVAVIEPSETHLYQPFFSHVAGGTVRADRATRPMRTVMPKDVKWIQDRVHHANPQAQTVKLASGIELSYDHAIICPGIQRDWAAVDGLSEAMSSPDAASNYEFDYAQKAWSLIRNFRSGTAVFVQPPGPASCAGAAQKPLYLACDYWRKQGVLDQLRVVLVVPNATVFGMDLIDEELNRKIAEYGIELHCDSELMSVDASKRSVQIRDNLTADSEQISYDLLHVVPPQSAPDWLKSTALSAAGDPGGFVEVNPLTLQHSRFPTVWSLGDAAGTTNSKSGGALREQTTILAKNLKAVRDGKKPTKKYTGYSVCPFTVSRSSVVLAEFDDEYRPKPSVPFWKGLARERRLTWITDRYILPWIYWNLILKGRA